MHDFAFFNLTARPLTPDDALPGISAEDDVFLALIAALEDALTAFQEAHPDLVITYGDVIQASKCLTDTLISNWAAESADA